MPTMRKTNYQHKHRSSETYALTLTVMYETKPGEDIYVVGSIKELGEWKDIHKAPLKWSKGHVWVTKDPLIV